MGGLVEAMHTTCPFHSGSAILVSCVSYEPSPEFECRPTWSDMLLSQIFSLSAMR